MKKKKWLLSCALIFVLLIAAVLAYFSLTTLSFRDIIRLSQKGEELRMEDFMRYRGTRYSGSYSESLLFTLSDEYEFEVSIWYGEERPNQIRLWYRPINRCCIDIRCFDVEEFVRAEDKSKYVTCSQYMSMDDVLRLSELGNDLRQDHIVHYKCDIRYYEFEEPPDGINFINSYPVNENYRLEVGDHDYMLDVAYARLIHIDSGEYIDIRTDDVDAFLAETEKRPMTMNDVYTLFQKGDTLSLEDFEPFTFTNIDGLDGVYLYDINEDFSLYVTEHYFREGLAEVELELKADRRYRIDIRTGDIDAYLAAADAHKVKKPTLTTDDIIRIAEKGKSLTPQDFIDYAGEYNPKMPLRSYILCEVQDGYLLEILEPGGAYDALMSIQLHWTGCNEQICSIDLRVQDAEAFIRAEDKSPYFHFSRAMTMNDVRLLSELGEELSQAHLYPYIYENLHYWDEVEAPDGINFIISYPLDDVYLLQVGDQDLSDEVAYAYLIHRSSRQYIDIRTDDVDAFLAAHAD